MVFVLLASDKSSSSNSVLRAESIVLKWLPAVVLYFTASEMENLRTESYFL